MAVNDAAKKYHMSRFMLRSRILEEKGLKTRKKQVIKTLAASLEIVKLLSLCQDSQKPLKVESLIFCLEESGSELEVSLLRQLNFCR